MEVLAQVSSYPNETPLRETSLKRPPTMIDLTTQLVAGREKETERDRDKTETETVRFQCTDNLGFHCLLLETKPAVKEGGRSQEWNFFRVKGKTWAGGKMYLLALFSSACLAPVLIIHGVSLSHSLIYYQFRYLCVCVSIYISTYLFIICFSIKSCGPWGSGLSWLACCCILDTFRAFIAQRNYPLSGQMNDVPFVIEVISALIVLTVLWRILILIK